MGVHFVEQNLAYQFLFKQRRGVDCVRLTGVVIQ